MEYENEHIAAMWLADEMRWGVFPRHPLRVGDDLGVSCDNLPVSQGSTMITGHETALSRRGYDPEGSLMGYFSYAREANCCLLPNGRVVVESLEVDMDTELHLPS